MEKDRKKKIIALLLIAVISTLSVAFAAVSRTININGTAKMDTANWDVHFDNLSTANLINTAEEINEPNYADNKGTIENINVKLKNPRDEVIYTVDIVNDGTMDAEVTVTSITDFTEEEAKLLDFGVYYSDGTKITKYDLLEAGKSKEVTIKLRYKDDITEFDLPEVPLAISFGFTINYIQSDASMVVTPNGDLESVKSVLATEYWDNATGTFYNGTLTKDKVESITFLSTLKVPSDAKDTAWDASLKKDGSVVAWYTDIDENNLYELNIGGNGKVYAPENSSFLFNNFQVVKEINFNNNFDTSNVTNMNAMFNTCSSVLELDLNDFDTSKVTNMYEMFIRCSSMEKLNLSSFNTSQVTNMENMFYSCSSLTSLDLSSFNTSNVTNMGQMFRACAAKKLNLSSFNTSKVTNMMAMFSACGNIEYLDLSNFDTSGVTNMDGLFSNSKIKRVNLTNFNTNNIKNMSFMFNNCSELLELDISSFNTSNVTTMQNMFYGCSKLFELDLSNFNTSNVISLWSMFDHCSSLENVNLSSFDTTKVTNMEAMFSGCSSLRNLDLSNFVTTNVTNIRYTFSYCSDLTINLSNAYFNNVTENGIFATFAYSKNITIIVKEEEQKTWFENKFGNISVFLESEM